MQNSDEITPAPSGSVCPNCRNLLNPEDRFCSLCGQKRTNLKDRSVWHFLVESVGDFFHFDSKFFRTVLDLIFRPGFLTGEFLSGKRARYFQPFKMFLFISVLYFIVAGLTGTDPLVNETAPPAGDTVITTENLDDIRFTFGSIDRRLVTMPLDTLKMQVAHYGLVPLVNYYHPRASWFDRLMIRQMVRNRIRGLENLNETFSHTLSKLIFVLIPVFALLLKLLYIRRKIPYFDHIIFSLHVISFIFLLLLLNLFLGNVSDYISLLLFLLAGIYVFLAMKRAYRQRGFKTLLKWGILMFSALIVIAGFFLLVLSVTVLII